MYISCVLCFPASTTTGVKKESAVLSDGSLDLLAREISGEPNLNYILLAMYLNTPTKAIEDAISCMSQGAPNTTKRDVTIRLLLEWKNKKSATVKEKEKVKQLEKALKEMGKTEWADMLMEKHTSNMELTAEALAQ